MRYIVILILIAATVLAVDPIGKNENNILYTWAGVDFEVYQQNAGIAGYRETALGADTLMVAFDISSATYDHAELWIEFTADAANGNYATVKTARNVAIYYLPSLAYTARTVTAGNRLNFANMNTIVSSVFAYAYRTITPDSTSYANKRLIDNIAGRTGGRTGVIGPFWIDATLPADSTGAGFIMITADTVGVSWRALIIPRT
jgi:hypothetical protein